jgi:hypothetical protein
MGWIAFADDLVDGAIPKNVDVRMGPKAAVKNLLGPELTAPMYEGDSCCVARQVQSFLHSGVAAAGHDDMTPPKKKPSQVAHAETPYPR